MRRCAVHGTLLVLTDIGDVCVPCLDRLVFELRGRRRRGRPGVVADTEPYTAGLVEDDSDGRGEEPVGAVTPVG